MLILKFFHILLAIIAVGSNITYGIWFARAKRNPESAVFALRGVKFIDDYLANPAYILMLPTGIALVISDGYSFATRWISWAMGLWLIAIIVAYAFYTPSLRRLIEAVASGGMDSPRARALDVRGRVYAAVLGVLVLAILLLMVFKPN